jgi:uncharacterized protein YcfJ
MGILLYAVTGIAVGPLAAQTAPVTRLTDARTQDVRRDLVDAAIARETALALECRECLYRDTFTSETNIRHNLVHAIQSDQPHRARNIAIGAIVGAVVGGTIGERVGQHSVDALCSGRDCSGPRLTPLYDAAYGAAIGALVGGLVGWVWPRPAT